MSTASLTPNELDAIGLCADLANLCAEIVADGPTREHDLAEPVGHIHNLQHALMAQAAARAYPERFRLLGDIGTGGHVRPVQDVPLPLFVDPNREQVQEDGWERNPVTVRPRDHGPEPVGLLTGSHFLDGSQEPVQHLARHTDGHAYCTGKPFDTLQGIHLQLCARCVDIRDTKPEAAEDAR